MPDIKTEVKDIFLYFQYVGADNKFWDKLQHRIKLSYPDKELHFSNFNTQEEYNPSALFQSLLHSSVNIIFIDFSFKIDQSLVLAKLLRNDNKTKLFSTVGLFDFLVDPHTVSRSLLAGIRLNHYKGDELSSIIYQSVVFFDPKKALEEKYALAKVNILQTLRQDLRMVFCTKQSIHIETNSPLVENETITLLKTQVNKKSERFHFNIQKVQDFDLYYNSRFYAVLTQKEAGGIKDLVHDKLTAVSKARSPKALKINVIDFELNILANKNFDFKKLPFSFNFQSKIHKDHIVIKRQRPMLIVVQTNETNLTIDAISDLITTVNSLDQYKPYVVIFNYQGSEKISKLLNYQKIIAYKEHLSWELIDKMSQSLADTLPDIPQDRLYFSSSSPEAIIKVEKEINVIGFNEQNIFFTTTEEIPMYTVFSMIYPIKMLVTIIPLSVSSEFISTKNVYCGLINLVSEDMSQKLRLEINQIFFTEKKKQKEEEARIRKELQQNYQKDKS